MRIERVGEARQKATFTFDIVKSLYISARCRSVFGEDQIRNVMNMIPPAAPSPIGLRMCEQACVSHSVSRVPNRA